MIPTLLAILLVVFMIIYLLPGSNPAEFSSHGKGDGLDSLLEKTDLHDTAFGKFLRYIFDLFINFDIGSRSRFENTLFRGLRIRVKYTLILTACGLAISILIGIPSGILSALHHNGPADRALSLASILFSALPPYVLAIILVLIFSKWLGWLPLFGIDTPRHFILPTLTIGAAGVALTAKMTRSAALEVMGKSYITALRAKGIGEFRIVFGHILRNSMVSILSSLNIILSSLLCGSLIVENFFSVSGIGQLVISSISQRSQRMLLACVAIIALLLMIVNILSDCLCALINPQIRLQYTRKKVKP